MPKRGKGCILLLAWEQEERRAFLATFFLVLGLISPPGTPGTCPRRRQAQGHRLVSPAEGTSALALVHFN